MKRKPILLALSTLLASCASNPSNNSTFTGTWIGNEAESIMPPGQHLPKNTYGIITDDGHVLSTTQITTDDHGKETRHLVWSSECNGVASPVQGAAQTSTVTLSCRRLGVNAFTMELKDGSGYSHAETCRLSSDGQKHTCAGTQILPDKSTHDFVYVFDRKK